MHRFYLPPEQIREDRLVLEEGEAHHAHDVLRLKPGDSATVLNGAGLELICQVQQVQRRGVILDVVDRKKHAPPPCLLTLFQAIPKGKAMDTIIQKATELSATRVVPMLTERCAVHLDASQAPAKTDKWRAVAIEAIKQCGAPWLPLVEVPRLLADCLADLAPVELPLVGSLESTAKHPRHFFQDFAEQHQRPPRSVCVCVGPEGDFTPGELGALQSAGARPISLGPLVLRSDTAAIYCLSMLHYEWRWWASRSGDRGAGHQA